MNEDVSMKVLQFMASDAYGGAEKVFVELSNALRQRHEVTALLLRNCAYRDRFSDQVHLIELQSNPTRHNPFLHFEIFSILKKLQPDIIHTHAAKGAELVKKVNRFLGYHHLATKHNDRKGRIFNSLPWVSAVSLKGKNSVISRKGGMVRVIYNGIVEEKVEQRNPADVFTMLAIGRLDKVKGFDLLVKQVVRLEFPFKLLLVGDGPEKDALTTLISDLALDEQVELLGFREDIAQLMHSCDLVVISSHREGGPKIMIEAMYYAPLLLSTPVGAVPEVIPPMFQSTLDDLAVNITQLHGNYSEAVAAFKSVSDQKKDKFSFPNVVRHYEQYYRDIISG